MEMMMRTIKMERAVNNNEWIEDEEKADPNKPIPGDVTLP